MRHLVSPYELQNNPAEDRNDPRAAVTAVELRFPKTFSARAWRVIRYMDGTMFLYSYKGKFVVTDESLYLTEHGDGTRTAPYGGPRWAGDSLDELEEWLEFIADDFDRTGDAPGWETIPKYVKVMQPKEYPKDVVVTVSADMDFVRIKTYDRQHGSRGRFIIYRMVVEGLFDEPNGTTRYDSDCGNYVMITRLEDSLRFSFAWLNCYGYGNVMGFRQDVSIPIAKIRMAIRRRETVKHLFTPASSWAKVDARPAAKTIRKIAEDKRMRRALSKALRDSFHWAGDTVTLYGEGWYNFFFTTESGCPKNGGLILHEGTKEGYPCIYFSVHT